MLAVLSPAKTLDFTRQRLTRCGSQPELLDDARLLAAHLQKFTPPKFAKLMTISDRLSTEVHRYFSDWQGQGIKPAILAFQGDVYQGLAADDFTAEDFAFAQDHLRILSGLYGVLRPLDRIEAYRLEMGTKLATPRGQTLYDFWGDKVTTLINRALAKQKDDVLVNLASNEYFRVVDTEQLQGTVITPAFKEYRSGGYKILSFFAKKARGQMARYLIKNQLSNPEDLKNFREDGYRFNAELSSETNWVFTRRQ